MLTYYEKIEILKNYLNKIEDNFADSFKTDILFYLGDFEMEKLNFLLRLENASQIEMWVDNLTSKIVLKFDEENEQLSDFIFEYAYCNYSGNSNKFCNSIYNR